MDKELRRLGALIAIVILVAAACSSSTTPSNVGTTPFPGWNRARLRIHESRGRIQVTSCGDAP